MKREQLIDLNTAYTDFVLAARALTPQALLTSLGDWSARDILAHFIGWNDITLTGCRELLQGKIPFYFYDGANDYRIVNAGFFVKYASTDREALLHNMSTTLAQLLAYLEQVDELDWERDTGIVHYRGGPATVMRCVDSLIRDYRKHRLEILK